MSSMLLWRARQALARPDWAARVAWNEVRGKLKFGRSFAALREPKQIGAWVHDRREYDALEAALVEQGWALSRRTVDREAYRAFVAAARYDRFTEYYDGGRSAGFQQKALEHWLGAELCGLRRDVVLIDVASQRSPAPQLYEEITGCTVYRQDLRYPAGLHERRIGGDAARMPVPDAFADAITLHNAFEHFEGDSDARFVSEAARVLKPGGVACIAPLFLASRYVVQTDPAVWPGEGVPFEPDALVCCARGWRDRHGRFYDLAHLESRIRANAGGLSLEVLSYPDAMDLDPGVYLRFVLLLRKPA